jgi:predicted nuclease of predicted toxin-antitoxin system
MAYARANELIVLTHDLDFGSILAVTHGEKPSVVQVRSQDVTPEAIGVHVVAALRQLGPELRDGALVTVDPRRTRLRVLPLRPRA